jgi:MFS transporter, OFA family, oxalate/formate antiporter
MGTVMAISSGGAPPRPGFRGWRVVLGAFITSMVGFGAVYSYGAFSATLASTFHASLTSTSIILSLSTGSAFATSAVSGVLTKRCGSRSLAVSGMVTIGIGLMLAAISTSLHQLYLYYGALVGIGTGLAYVPAFAAVQRWFITWRGLASGIAASGIGVGTFLISPMTELLSSVGDWRITFKICSFLAVFIGIIGALLLSDSPDERGGEFPDDIYHPGLPHTEAVIISLRDAVRSQTFTWMYCGILLVSLPVVLPYAYLASSALSSGFDGRHALGLISILGIGSILGRGVIAVTADHFGRRRVFLVCCMGITIATVVWAIGSGLLFYGFALSFGIFYGGFVALLPAFTVDNFGRHNAASIMGLIYSGRAIAGLLGPPFVAHLIARWHGHMFPLETVAIFSGLGCYLLIRVRPLVVEV